MDRRRFLGGSLALFAVPLVAGAQEPPVVMVTSELLATRLVGSLAPPYGQSDGIDE
jgi:hypothetical protein